MNVIHCVECGGAPRLGRLRCAACIARMTKYVTVCDRCLRSSCWQGVFMCDEARTAGTMDLDVRYLALRALESPSYTFSKSVTVDPPNKTAPPSPIGMEESQMSEHREGCEATGERSDAVGDAVGKQLVADLRSAVSADRPEQRLVIRVNSNLNWSRGKMAAHAVHAALKLYGIEYTHPVIVLGSKPAEILEQTVTVRDAGRTELEPGTLTAGASWEGAAE